MKTNLKKTVSRWLNNEELGKAYLLNDLKKKPWNLEGERNSVWGDFFSESRAHFSFSRKY